MLALPGISEIAGKSPGKTPGRGENNSGEKRGNGTFPYVTARESTSHTGHEIVGVLVGKSVGKAEMRCWYFCREASKGKTNAPSLGSVGARA